MPGVEASALSFMMASVALVYLMMLRRLLLLRGEEWKGLGFWGRQIARNARQLGECFNHTGRSS